MNTVIVPALTPNERDRAIAQAVALLRAGEVVALPTETVYGLAADALAPHAVAKIFEAKERPRFDPLIVHLPGRDWLARVAGVDPALSSLVVRLMERFWPGPLTMLLPKTELIPDIVTSGLTTVAVRMSAHPVFAAVARELDRPIAAPSANRFGRISPTRARDVLDELDGKIPLIVDGGAAEHGIESTIVAPSHNGITILREGPITHEQLARFGPIRRASETPGRPSAPGQLPSHYAPRTPLFLVEDISHFALPAGTRCGALLWRGAESGHFAESRRLSETHDLREAAANLFRYLRGLDGLGLDLIVAEHLPGDGLGAAIMDRLRRAARRS